MKLVYMSTVAIRELAYVMRVVAAERSGAAERNAMVSCAMMLEKACSMCERDSVVGVEVRGDTNR